MREDIAIEVLKQVKNVLDKYNVEFWLDIGTLLGAVRDGKIIAWDHDIDLSIWEENIPKIVSACKELLDKGFSIKLHRTFMSIEKGNLPINFGFYHLANSKGVRIWLKNYYLFNRFLGWLSWGLLPSNYSKVPFRSSFNAKSLAKICLAKINSVLPLPFRKWFAKIESKLSKKILWMIPSYYFTELSIIKFYGMEFKVPAKTKEYLVYRYGKDWRIPRKDWVTEKDDGAIVLVDDYIEGNF